MEQMAPDQGCTWVRIIIVAYRSSEHLQPCLDSLKRQSFTNFEVVIVDNNCPEQSAHSVTLPDDRFRIIHADENLGFAGGVNLGAEGAATEWVATLNPDTSVQMEWLAELYAASQSEPSFDVLGSTQLNAADPELVDGFGDVLSIYGICWRGGHGAKVGRLPKHNIEVFGACAAAACYRTKVFRDLGGFDEAYFCYLEDVDLSFRLQNANCKCLQVRDAIVHHWGGKSSDENRHFATQQSYKNNLRLIVQNARPLILVPMLSLYIIAQFYSLLRNRRSPLTRSRWMGLKASLRTIPSALSRRRSVQGKAQISSLDLVRRLDWKPSSIKRQAIFRLISDDS